MVIGESMVQVRATYEADDSKLEVDFAVDLELNESSPRTYYNAGWAASIEWHNLTLTGCSEHPAGTPFDDLTSTQLEELRKRVEAHLADEDLLFEFWEAH
tara:strand:+ start:529 stop:828 length:300 start_codon:yes stop_codon:yes gene_type:complete